MSRPSHILQDPDNWQLSVSACFPLMRELKEYTNRVPPTDIRSDNTSILVSVAGDKEFDFEDLIVEISIPDLVEDFIFGGMSDDGVFDPASKPDARRIADGLQAMVDRLRAL